MHAIQFDNVSKQFVIKRDRRNSFHERLTGLFKPKLRDEEFWALRDVSFSVRRGETLGLIGHNGSGKSTTLKLITRILEPTQGRISVSGRVSALLELGSGFHPDLTGRENIYLNGSLLGFTRAEMASKIESIIDFSEMREFIDMSVKHYSSGMYMRLGFAVAIYSDPDILITDEVLAVGDEAFQRKCMDRIYALKRQGVTILFVSHALGQVRDLCDRALWFDHGKLMLDAAPTEAIDAYLADTNVRDAERVRREAEEEDRLAAEAEAESAAEEPAEAAEEPPAEAAEGAEEPAEDAEPVAEPEQPRFVTGVFLRWGTREAEITRVEFLSDGAATRTVTTGAPLTIRMHYLAHERIEDPVFGVGIYHRTGFHINGPNSRFSGLTIPAIEGAGFVDYQIDSLPLLEGDYHITAAIYDHTMSHPFDHHERRFTLKVYTTSINERFGNIYIPSSWDWQPAQPAVDEPVAS